MENDTTYKICIRLPDTRPLTYFVSNYETLEGGLIKFYDSRNNKFKIIDSRLCEIEVMEQDE